MPRFAANLSLLFTELPFLDRFAAAASEGFRAVEVLFPYEHPAQAVAAALREAGLDLVLLNAPPGDWAAGERGLGALPERREEAERGIATALAYARATGARRIHVMAGLADPRDEAAQAAYRAMLRYACPLLAAEGIILMIEPINRRSMPGYFLNDVDGAADLVAEMRGEGHANLALQFDIFHAQILHGDATTRLRRLMPLIGHVQVAAVPDRGEPGTGELDEAHLFRQLDAAGYKGHVGCEYNPRAGTREGLGWFQPYRAAQG